MRKRLVLAIAALLVLSLAAVAVKATTALDLDWSSVTAGGGLASAGNYEMQASIAQPHANTSSGGRFDLQAGFLPGVERPPPSPTPTRWLYLPLLER